MQCKDYEKLKSDAKIYWAAHVNLMRYTKKIIAMIRQRRKKYRDEPKIDVTESKEKLSKYGYPKNLLEKKFQEKYHIDDR